MLNNHRDSFARRTRTFRNSKFASGIFGEEDFSTRMRRHTYRLRTVFPVFDGVGLALNGSWKGLRSERSLHGDAKRRTGRVIGSGQGVAVSSFGVCGAFLWEGGGWAEGDFPDA